MYSPGIVHTPTWEWIDAAHTTRTGAPVGSALHGWTDTIPLGRLETPDDVAGVVPLLASPDAACITGLSIVVDGGLWFS